MTIKNALHFGVDKMKEKIYTRDSFGENYVLHLKNKKIKI